MFCDSVRGFAEKHLAAGALARAHQDEHPWDVAKLMAGQGLMGIAMKEEDGGQGGTLMDAILAIETVAQVCPRSADVIQAGNFGPVRVLAEYGTRDQKDRYLTRILRGESVTYGRHDRARGRQRGDRSHDHRDARRRRLAHQRRQSFPDPRISRRSDADLCALRPRRRRHRLGADPARCRGFQAGQAPRNS